MAAKISEAIIKSVLAGIMIGIAGALFLAVDNRYIGAVLFGIGLFCIFSFGFKLYTGMIGYLVTEKSKLSYLMTLAAVWVGNLAGTGICAGLLRLTRAGDKFSQKALSMCEVKLSDSALSVFILAVFCGILMFVAADNFKNGKGELQKYLAVFLSVSVFILSGFEHCVANMFFFFICGSFTLKTLVYLLIMTAGNSVGAFIIPLGLKLSQIKHRG